MKLIICSLLLMFCSPAKSSPISLGQGFLLEQENLLGVVETGFTIFADKIPSKCIISDSKNKGYTRGFGVHEKKGAFEEFVKTKVNLVASKSGDTTIKGTFNAMYDTSSKEYHEVVGISLDVVGTNIIYTIDKSCLKSLELSDEFVKAFEKLPTDIKHPSEDKYWVDYYNFIHRFGSHISTGYTTGSKYKYWALSMLDKKYSSTDFQARVCADVEGVNTDEPGFSVNGCAAYSSSEKKKSLDYSMETNAMIFGGSSDTRAKLTIKPTSKEFINFLEESNKSDQVIENSWTSIWDMLLQKYPGGENFTRALTLQAYYEGYIDFSCPLITAKNKVLDQTLKMQWFYLKDKTGDNVNYACKIGREGCHNLLTDCHANNQVLPTACYCYGPTCEEHKKDHNGIYRPSIRQKKEGSYTEGINNSCGMFKTEKDAATADNVGDFYCGCDDDWDGHKSYDLWIQNQQEINN